MVVRGRERRGAGDIRGNRFAGERAGYRHPDPRRCRQIARSADRARVPGRGPAAGSPDQPADDADGRLPRRQKRRGGEDRGRAAAKRHRAAAGRRRDAVHPGRQHQRSADRRRQRLSARRRHRDQRQLDGPGQQQHRHDVQLEHQRFRAKDFLHLLSAVIFLPVCSAGDLRPVLGPLRGAGRRLQPVRRSDHAELLFPGGQPDRRSDRGLLALVSLAWPRGRKRFRRFPAARHGPQFADRDLQRLQPKRQLQQRPNLYDRQGPRLHQSRLQLYRLWRERLHGGAALCAR